MPARGARSDRAKWRSMLALSYVCPVCTYRQMDSGERDSKSWRTWNRFPTPGAHQGRAGTPGPGRRDRTSVPSRRGNRSVLAVHPASLPLLPTPRPPSASTGLFSSENGGIREPAAGGAKAAPGLIVDAQTRHRGKRRDGYVAFDHRHACVPAIASSSGRVQAQ